MREAVRARAARPWSRAPKAAHWRLGAQPPRGWLPGGARSAGRNDAAPCFAQDVVAVLEKPAKLYWLAGVDLLHSQGHAPTAGGFVGVCVGGDEPAVRACAHHCLDRCVARQVRERGALEVDDVLPLVLADLVEAAAHARLHDPGIGRPLLQRALPVDVV